MAMASYDVASALITFTSTRPTPYRWGLTKPPAAKWLTMLDAERKDKTPEGDPFGEILVSAYIDEEYLEHLHHQKAGGRD